MEINHEKRQVPPSISVVCPTYNSAAYVAATIQSVLNQTVPPLEFIISDDGSVDDTVAVVERMSHGAPCDVQILKNPHQGPGAARNAGIRAAQGEWIAFLDSDDRWKPEKIARVTTAMREYPRVNFFCHDEEHRRFDGSSSPLYYGLRHRKSAPLPQQLFYNNFFSTSAVVCKRSLLLEHGFFNETLMSAQDYELWLRLSPFIQPYFIRESLGYYVDRKGNITSGKKWRRMANELRALSRNKDKVGSICYTYALARHIALFCIQIIRQ